MKFVSEISCSHAGEQRNAINIIDQLDPHFVDYVKFQCWTPETMAVEYQIEEGPWAGMDLRELYREAQTPLEWLPVLFRAAINRGLGVCASVFDLASLELLESLSCPMYKIASFEAVDLQLIEAVAMTEKPIIISTGQIERHEIRAAVHTVLKWHNDITLLHCVSEYPTSIEHANLRTIQGLKDQFPYCKVGLSDHSIGPVVPIAAATLGCDMIEKHVALDGLGLDASFASTPAQINDTACMAKQAQLTLGEIKFAKPGKLRRSLYFAQDLKAGTEIQGHHIKTARPNLGLSPIKIDKVLGHTLAEDVRKDQPVELSSVDR